MKVTQEIERGLTTMGVVTPLEFPGPCREWLAAGPDDAVALPVSRTWSENTWRPVRSASAIARSVGPAVTMREKTPSRP